MVALPQTALPQAGAAKLMMDVKKSRARKTISGHGAAFIYQQQCASHRQLHVENMFR